MEVTQGSAGTKAPVRALPGVEAIAFFGNHFDDAEDGTHVQVLIWPTTPEAWTVLTQSWRVLRSTDIKKPAVGPPSWVRRYASQLCAVFGDHSALETSVAALITRAAMGVSIALSPADRPLSQRDMFLQCLQAYQEFLGTPGRSAWAAAVIDPPGNLETIEQNFRSALQGIPFPRPPALHIWEGGIEPIPLEIARVASGAVARYLADRNAANPIFEAVQRKMGKIPVSLTLPLRMKRR